MNKVFWDFIDQHALEPNIAVKHERCQRILDHVCYSTVTKIWEFKGELDLVSTQDLKRMFDELFWFECMGVDGDEYEVRNANQDLMEINRGYGIFNKLTHHTFLIQE